MGGRNYFFDPPRSIIHQYERCSLRSQQRMILIVIQNQYHYTQTSVVCLTTILNWVPLWGRGTHGKIPTLPTSHHWSDNRAGDKLSYVLRPRLISVLHSQEDFPPELQMVSEGKHNKMESDKTRRCPITTSARSDPPTNKSIFSIILPLTVCRLWSLRVENCFNFNSVQNTTNTILRAFCNETNLSITSTQSNLFNELQLQRFVWAKERREKPSDWELSTAKTFLAIISLAGSDVFVSVSQYSMLNSNYLVITRRDGWGYWTSLLIDSISVIDVMCRVQTSRQTIKSRPTSTLRNSRCGAGN